MTGSSWTDAPWEEPKRGAPWLSIIGIGEDGHDGLSLAARQRLTQACLVVGGARHLALAGPVGADTMTWPTPIADALPKILARRGEPVCILASGDPFFYGVGTLLAAAVAPEEYVCLPSPSSFSLAAARLGWSLQDCRLVSLHGRDPRRIVPHLRPRAKILALTWDGSTASRIAALLRDFGCGQSIVHVLEAMGGARERCREARAAAFALDDIAALNVVAVEVVAGRDARLVALAPGVPDEWFLHDGQITKRDIRAVTLAALRPFPGAHLWDIGAGSGSVAIEWALCDPANRATAIESRPERAQRIRQNADRFGTTDLVVVEGRAPEALAALPAPDAIFIGGGVGDGTLIETALAALPDGGRLVVNAVTLETQAHLIACHRANGGDLRTISICQADPVGRFHGWRPAMPVMQWAIGKAAETAS